MGGMDVDDVTTKQDGQSPGRSCCGPTPSTAGTCCGDSGTSAQPEPQPSCCTPHATAEADGGSSCCCGESTPAPYSYAPLNCIIGAVETPVGRVPKVSGDLDSGDRLGACRVRWGIGREDYRAEPGLYALGEPGTASPVLVTANYKLTFDELRSSLDDLDAWLLVVDTRGINVWCAAGKGTFCAEEVARVVRETRLAEVVEHRRLVLPQLSAPGVAAHKVKEACGFRVTFGPVRAADLPAFLATGMKADAEMRRVVFDLRERAVVVPEVLSVVWHRRMLMAYAGILAASAIGRDGVSLRRGLRDGAPVIGAAWLALMGGGAVTPLALPWLPGRAFSGKGAVVGGILSATATATLGRRLSPAAKLALLAGVTAASSYIAMDFTGSSTITSPSGVEAEMRKALPLQGAGAALAAGAWLVSRLGR